MVEGMVVPTLTTLGGVLLLSLHIRDVEGMVEGMVVPTLTALGGVLLSLHIRDVEGIAEGMVVPTLTTRVCVDTWDEVGTSRCRCYPSTSGYPQSLHIADVEGW
ncbi:MAG: hypothetical protein AMXMBFR61_07160 [Fimbriimonadales bacterium]